jgi:uracil-DNA glycosylase
LTLGPVIDPIGPRTANIILLGDCPSDEESSRSTPFIGPAGHELRRMLSTLGVSIHDTYRTFVFNRQPPDDIGRAYGTTTPSEPARRLGAFSTQPKLWINDVHLPRLEALYSELASIQPNIIIALGPIASWSLGLGIASGDLRGNIYQVQLPGLASKTKVLVTHHPSSVLKQWSLRPIVLADLQKAWNNSENPDLRFDNTELWLAPSLEDILEFDQRFMSRTRITACDIETRHGQITCISFAPSDSVSLCIPFWQKGPCPNYFPDAEGELKAWGFVKKWLERADLVKLFQNGLYDLQYLALYGIAPRNCTEDTMLAHHSLYSELPKGLGFLGSLYANVPAWKKMRSFAHKDSRIDEFKKDD